MLIVKDKYLLCIGIMCLIKFQYIFMKKLFFLLSFCFSFLVGFAQDGKGAINVVAFPEGVTITFMGQEYKNNIDLSSISAGQYKAMLYKAGYNAVDTMLEVKEGVTKYYNIVLTQKKSESDENSSVLKHRKYSHNKNAIETNYYALAQVVLSDCFSQAGMFGMTFNGDGFYLKGVKTFLNKPKLGGNIGGHATKEKVNSYKYTYAEALAGYLHEFGSAFTGYVGAGYGKRRAYQKYTDGEYYYSKDDFVDGAAVDFGGIVRIKNFCISAGVNTINFNVFALNVGLGLTF